MTEPPEPRKAHPITPKQRTTVYVDRNLLVEFKKICFREEESVSGKVEGFIARYVSVHMHGNPQLRLESFVGKTRKKCFLCEGLYETVFKVRFISGLVAPTCKVCLEEQRARTTVKKVLGVYE